MAPTSIAETGLRGIQQGFSDAANHADQLSTAFQPNGSGDPVASIIGLEQAKFQVEASAKVIKLDQELTGTILDIFA